MFYAAEDKLYAVPLTENAPLRRVDSTFVADQWTKCIFTDR